MRLPEISKTIQVPDDAVTIERENWEPTFGGALGGDQPAWATATDSSLDDDGIPNIWDPDNDNDGVPDNLDRVIAVAYG